MLSFPAITQLLTRNRSFEAAAVSRRELYPASEAPAAPAIYLPDTISRVSGLWTGNMDEHTWQLELERIAGGVSRHQAIEILEYRDVKLHEGFLYAGGAKSQLEPHPQSLKPMGSNAPRIKEAALACTLFGNRYFGHFLIDDMPLTMLAERFAPPIRSGMALSDHQRVYAGKLGLHAECHTSAHIERLHTFIDFGQGDYKRERYQTIRQNLLKDVAPSGYPGAMILRGTTGVLRQMVNEGEFADFLAGMGFAILDPLRMPVDEIVQTLCNVPVVVGVEGSQLLHAPWTMSEKGTLLVLQPPFRFNNVNKNYTDCLGQKYAFVIGHPQGDGFVIDRDEFKKVLDMAMR